MIFSSRLIGLKLTSSFTCGYRSFTSTAFRPLRKECDPLRILFCGSDDFSVASLNALHHEREGTNLAGIESIDVVCRPAIIRDVAKNLDLTLHEIDTFTGWQPPSRINLVVAVSFGLLVPRRILGHAKYGGLNVHPSFLPDLRGAAPIEHALLQRRSRIGVSVQTLHPSKMDHGDLIAQTPLPGVSTITDPPFELFALKTLLQDVGARMLIDCLRDRTFVAPLQPVQLSNEEISETTDGNGLAFAPRITTEDRHLDWDTMTNAEVLLRNRVLGHLWDTSTHEAVQGKQKKRIVYEDWSSQAPSDGITWQQFGANRYVSAPWKQNDKKDGRLARNGVSVIMRVDTSVDEDDPTRRIYSSSFTVDGRPRNAGGRYFAEVLRQRKHKGENQS